MKKIDAEFIQALCDGDFVRAKSLLNTHRVDWQACTRDDKTSLLSLSLEAGELAPFFIHQCLKNGVNVNHANINGATVLLLASMDGMFDIVNMLLAHGADILHEDKNKFNSLFWAMNKGHHNVAKTLLFSCDKISDLEKIVASALESSRKYNLPIDKELLLKFKKDVQFKCDMESALRDKDTQTNKLKI